jgi:hypothetical protein
MLYPRDALSERAFRWAKRSGGGEGWTGVMGGGGAA